jgi:hypothetical protein
VFGEKLAVIQADYHRKNAKWFWDNLKGNKEIDALIR